MSALIFIAFLTLFTGIIFYQCKKGFVKSGFGIFLTAFYVRVFAGSVIALWFSTQPSDSWGFFNNAAAELELLKNSPLRFFQSLFVPLTKEGSLNNFFIQGNSFDRFRNVIMSKILTVMMLFCGKNFYTILIIFNWFVLMGTYRLYKAVEPYLESKNEKWGMFLLLFFFPPLLIWTSFYHKDGFIWAFTCFAVYYFFSWLRGRKIKHLLQVIIFLLLITLLRSYAGVTLALSFIIWFVFSLLPIRKYAAFFLTSLAAFFILFFLSSFLPDNLNFPLILADKQYAINRFFQGNTTLSVFPLTESVYSYLRNTPYMFYNLFVAAVFENVPFYKSLLPLAENILVWAAIIVLLFFRKPQYQIPKEYRGFLYAIFFYTIINYWVIGQSVPVLGAILRYKITFEVLFLLAVVSMADYQKLTRSLSNIFRKNS